MIGRWSSAVGAMGLQCMAKKVLTVAAPFLAFGLFLFANKITGHEIDIFYPYVISIFILIAADFLSKGNPAKQLIIYSCLGIVALVLGMIGEGLVSTFAFISVGLFCSTLWPCIFTLAIKGLGKHTNEGSGFLIMMIMGGGFISLLQGYLAGSERLGIQYSYIVGVLCFIYLAFYGWKSIGLLKAQGIEVADTAA
jgi:FHS family L-fucose permease-like MFS transporter